MPPFLKNSRLSSTGCSVFPPSEGNKLNTILFTACPQVSSGRGEAEPEASHSMGTNQCGCAGFPQLWGWPQAFVLTLSWGSCCRNAGLARCAAHSIPSPPKVPGYQLPLLPLEQAGVACLQHGKCSGILGNGHQHVRASPVPGHNTERVRAVEELFLLEVMFISSPNPAYGILDHISLSCQ